MNTTPATEEAGAPPGNRTASHIARLLNRLNWLAPLIVLLASLTVAVSLYLLQARPLADAVALTRQHNAAEQVVAKTENMVGQVERILLTFHEWSRDGLTNLDDPGAFNRLMIPVIQQRSIVSSIHLADDSGREILLLKVPDGWKNRITDVPKKGKQQHWLLWHEDRSAKGDEWKEQDYDPRKRPWFSGAMATPESQVYWTAPYIFQSTKDPGITASLRWTDKKTGRQLVVAFDVMLTDLSRFTTRLTFGNHGQVALLTADNKLLGLPHHENFNNDEALKKALLQEPGELGLTALAGALRLNAEAPSGPRDTLRIPAQVGGGEEDWIASVFTLPVRNQTFRIATLAPESDFDAVSGKLASILSGLMILISIAALIAARGMVGAVRRPITALIDKMQADTAQIENQAARRTVLRDITQHLQQALTPRELAQTLLSELAPRLHLGQALFCLWDEEAGKLRATVRYGGPGATPETILAADVCQGNLLAQCAADRQPILIDSPGPAYFRVQSGLGDCPPAAILILPLCYAGRLFAVLEVAGLHGFSDDHRQLLAELEPTVAMSLDILLRAESTAELLASTALAEERSRLILSSVGDGIWGMDSHGVTTFVNKAALEMLGFDETDVIGKRMHDLVHQRYPDGRTFPLERCAMFRTGQDGQPRTVDDEVLWRKDGVALPVEYSTTAIHRQNEVIGVVVVFRDITERRSRERARRDEPAHHAGPSL